MVKSVKIYVEGGGDTSCQQSRCRKGFSDLLSQIPEIVNCKPRIIACGGRGQAFDAFKNEIKNGDDAVLLLVDSERPVPANYACQPWAFLKTFETWDGLAAQTDESKCHLMVQAMEAWLIADPSAMKAYYGNAFKTEAFKALDVEKLTKTKMDELLSKATKNCKTKPNYDKGRDSFNLLEKIDLNLVVAASPWAKRFVEHVKQACVACTLNAKKTKDKKCRH